MADVLPSKVGFRANFWESIHGCQVFFYKNVSRKCACVCWIIAWKRYMKYYRSPMRAAPIAQP